MTDNPIAAERIAQQVSAALATALPPESVAGVVANYRLLLSHWAIFGSPAKDRE